MFPKVSLIDIICMLPNVNNNRGFSSSLSAFGDVLGIANYIMNMNQTNNDELMRELQKQDKEFLINIVESQKRIEEKLDRLLKETEKEKTEQA